MVSAYEADPVNLDPHRNSGQASLYAWGDLVYQSLTMFDEKGNVVPALAESWENPDPLTWVFKLRKGVKFHNGDELEAEDLVFWLRWMNDPNTAAVYKTFFTDITKVEPVDKYTARFVLKNPYSPLLPMLANMQGSVIAPRKWGEAKVKWDMEAVGTGPFKIAEYVPYSHIKYVKNKDYWEKGLPYLDEMTFKVTPEEEARIAALRAGAVQHALVTAEGAKRLAAEKSIAVLKRPTGQLIAFVPNGRRKPYDDVRVRQAINLVIDRKELIEKAAGGEGILTGPLPPGLKDYSIPTDELEKRWYTPDIAKAKKLMADAGYANGFKTKILCSPQYPWMVDSAVVLQKQVKAIGIEMEVVQQEWGTMLKAIGVSGGYDFDIHPNAWGAARGDPDFYMSRSYNSKSDNNYTGIGTPKVDELIAKARSTANIEERKQLYRQVQETVLDEAWYMFVCATNSIEGVASKLKGYEQHLLGRRTWFKKSWLGE